MHIFHSWPSMTLVSFQNLPAPPLLCPALRASTNCCDSGKTMRSRPTPMDRPAAIQKMVFHESTLPPTPRLAQAAQT